jgi:hypothetical protein
MHETFEVIYEERLGHLATWERTGMGRNVIVYCGWGRSTLDYRSKNFGISG